MSGGQYLELAASLDGYRGAWAWLTGYVESAAERSEPVDPQELLSHMQRLSEDRGLAPEVDVVGNDT